MAHRLFVGVELPQRIRTGLSALQGGLRGARWVAPESLHLTLRFIGEVDRRQAEDIAAELGALRAPRFAVRLAGAGTFGSDRRPRALWAGIAPSPDLHRLKRQVDSLCARAGLGPDERRFAPHVTLARIRSGVRGAAERRANALAGAVTGEFPVEDVVLFESRLGAGGPHYERVVRYPLDPA